MITSTTLTRNLGTAALALGIALTASGAARLEDPEHTQPLGSLAPFVLSSTNLEAGGVKGYRPWFENGSWQGDIGEYDVSTTGALSSTVSYAGTTPTNSDPDNGNWSALVTFREKLDADADYWQERKIITMVGGSQVPFEWSQIGAANRALIDENAEDDGADESSILNFIRGDESEEFCETDDGVLCGGELRDRVSVLGDIIHNKPVHVGPPSENLVENGYATWATELKDRERRVYAGMNDGMLHAFDASDGSEAWAYIPSMLMPGLRELADVPYRHRFFVDGHITVADAYFNAQGTTGDNAGWHSVLVGTLGAGGKGIFALDITDPDLDNANSPGEGDTKAMWERSAAGDDDLGYTYTKGVIARLNDGNWYVVIGNGYSSVNGKAVLYIINIATGAVKKISTNSGSAGSPNGLSSPTLLDEDRDGDADVAYAGDIDGNLWEFDLSSNDKDAWGVAYGGQPLYDGLASQPITVQPRIALHPVNGYLIYFSTGKLLSPEDKADTSVQGLFAIHDDGATPPNAQKFHTQPFEAKEYVSDDISEGIAIYTPDSGDVDWNDSDVIGWRVLFPAGQRILRPIQIRSSRVKGTLFDPTDEAAPNWMLEAAIWDGGPHTSAIYDLNRDGALDADDLYNNGTQEEQDWKVPMLWKRQNGIMSEVTIARVKNGVDTLFLNYLVPPVDEVCVDDCPGFQGGHVDLDSSHRNMDWDGPLTTHHHEYDKLVGRVYIDFFDLNVPAQGLKPPRKNVDGQVEIDDVGGQGGGTNTIGRDERFVIILANADFSPGSTMTIKDKDDWHVWEYQVAIHLALKNWNPQEEGSRPVYDRDWIEDDDNDDWDPIPLDFSWGEIADADSTIKHSFNDRSIIDGGLHPTQTGCVKNSAFGDPADDPRTLTEINGELVGRWRNGALTTQLVALSHFTSNPAINDVRITYPLDLRTSVPVPGFGDLSSRIDLNGNGTFERANHEFIGGLVAATAEERLYESTLFWHFGDLSQLLLGTKPCYGDPEWPEAVRLERANDPLAEALDLLDDDTDFDFSDGDLADAYEQVQACIDSQSGQAASDCRKLYKLLEKLEEVIENYEINDNNDSNDSGDGDPEVIEGDVTQQTDTQGTVFEYGRMSWTDVP